MNLKEELIKFGCGLEFVDIALEYASEYNPEEDIETFIEYVEEEHAKVEAAEEAKEKRSQFVDASSIFEEFKDTSDEIEQSDLV